MVASGEGLPTCWRVPWFLGFCFLASGSLLDLPVGKLFSAACRNGLHSAGAEEVRKSSPVSTVEGAGRSGGGVLSCPAQLLTCLLPIYEDALRCPQPKKHCLWLLPHWYLCPGNPRGVGVGVLGESWDVLLLGDKGTEEIALDYRAQLVEGLPSMHKNLALSPRSPKPGMTAHILDPSTWELLETGGPGGQGHFWLHSKQIQVQCEVMRLREKGQVTQMVRGLTVHT